MTFYNHDQTLQHLPCSLQIPSQIVAFFSCLMSHFGITHDKQLLRAPHLLRAILLGVCSALLSSAPNTQSAN